MVFKASPRRRLGVLALIFFWALGSPRLEHVWRPLWRPRRPPWPIWRPGVAFKVLADALVVNRLRAGADAGPAREQRCLRGKESRAREGFCAGRKAARERDSRPSAVGTDRNSSRERKRASAWRETRRRTGARESGERESRWLAFFSVARPRRRARPCASHPPAAPLHHLIPARWTQVAAQHLDSISYPPGDRIRLPRGTSVRRLLPAPSASSDQLPLSQLRL